MPAQFTHIFIVFTDSVYKYTVYARNKKRTLGVIQKLYGEYIFFPYITNYTQDQLAEILAALEVANVRVSIKPEPTDNETNGYEF